MGNGLLPAAIHSNSNYDTDSNVDTDSNLDRYPDTLTDIHWNKNADCFGIAIGKSVLDGHSWADINAHEYTDENSDPDQYSESNENSDPYANLRRRVQLREGPD